MEVNRANINSVGTRIKERRKKLSLTIAEMASYTGLSSGHISNIERNATSPTLANLSTICEVLGISMNDLLQAETTNKVVVRKKDMTIREYPDENMVMRVIDFGTNEDLYEYVTIQPGESKNVQEYRHPYDEIGTVLSGTLVICIEGKRYELNKNDSIYIEAKQLHSTRNEGTRVSESFWHYRKKDESC